ncbi:proline-rich extensin-like protein EPR1 [Nilaparvata lugens]|uniref:proline-rich extensin-like protein EPR1 n=1 Tax=Nilaparvata lugens TaxID=108931 RepID=UPI00193E3083|nr:proline-rich extensin-like protein EPR1 [Nilaparvata lugens]
MLESKTVKWVDWPPLPVIPLPVVRPPPIAWLPVAPAGRPATTDHFIGSPTSRPTIVTSHPTIAASHPTIAASRLTIASPHYHHQSPAAAGRPTTGRPAAGRHHRVVRPPPVGTAGRPAATGRPPPVVRPPLVAPPVASPVVRPPPTVDLLRLAIVPPAEHEHSQ